MNLDQLLSLEDIEKYMIWWYGAGIYSDYMDDNGLLRSFVEMKQKNVDIDCIYLIMSGESRNTCRYRFSIKLKATEQEGIYEWDRVPLQLDRYSNRIVFFRKSGFSFYNSSKTGKDFIVEEIWPESLNRTVCPFSTYDEVDLSFMELKEAVDNRYPDYYKSLSCVKGVYMIIGGNTGKMYIGSAYGENGIWGRWESYADNYHGNNEELVRLYDEHGEKYFEKFRYSILQILSMKVSDKEVIDRENYYKSRFLTREFGLNKN